MPQQATGSRGDEREAASRVAEKMGLADGWTPGGDAVLVAGAGGRQQLKRGRREAYWREESGIYRTDELRAACACVGSTCRGLLPALERGEWICISDFLLGQIMGIPWNAQEYPWLRHCTRAVIIGKLSNFGNN